MPAAVSPSVSNASTRARGAGLPAASRHTPGALVELGSGAKARPALVNALWAARTSFKPPSPPHALASSAMSMVRSDGPPGVTTESGTRFQAVWKRLRERLTELSKRGTAAAASRRRRSW